MATNNKALNLPLLNSSSWNTPLNENFTYIDDALGGYVTLSSTSGTTTLSASQYQPLVLVCSGSLTGNTIYEFPSTIGGQWIVYNNTSGAYTLTFRSAAGGAVTVIDQNTISTIFSDGTSAIGVQTSGGRMPSQKIRGRKTAGVGNVEDITSSDALDFLGNTQGNILYRGASEWGVLAPGTTGYPLLSKGAAANPAFDKLALSALDTTGTASAATILAGDSSYIKANPGWQWWVDTSSGTIVDPSNFTKDATKKGFLSSTGSIPFYSGSAGALTHLFAMKITATQDTNVDTYVFSTDDKSSFWITNSTYPSGTSFKTVTTAATKVEVSLKAGSNTLQILLNNTSGANGLTYIADFFANYTGTLTYGGI
jgi:hypothetical protein